MQLFTSCEGRISRKSFWLGLLGIFAASVVAILVLGLMFSLTGRPLVHASMAVSFILLWPMFAIAVKRLHDRDKAAMPWVAIFFGPSFLANMMRDFEVDYSVITLAGEQAFYPGKFAMTITVISLITGIWALIELGILKGSTGENSFGPDPRG